MCVLMDTAMKLLSDKPYTEFELGKQLEKMFADTPNAGTLIQNTLKRLHELHLLNDHRLAEGIAARYTHKGNSFTIQILRQRGIRDEVIEEVLAQLGDEYPRALDEARQKCSSLREEHPEKAKIQVYRFLLGRGFSYDTIKTVCKELGNEGSFGITSCYEECK